MSSACLRAWLNVLALLATPFIAGLAIWVIMRQTELISGQRDTTERVRWEGLLKELATKLTEVEAHSSALLTLLACIRTAHASNDLLTVDALLQQLRVSPSIQFVHISSTAGTKQALNDLLVYLQFSARKSMMNEFEDRITRLMDLIARDARRLKADYGQAYEDFIGTRYAHTP